MKRLILTILCFTIFMQNISLASEKYLIVCETGELYLKDEHTASPAAIHGRAFSDFLWDALFIDNDNSTPTLYVGMESGRLASICPLLDKPQYHPLKMGIEAVALGVIYDVKRKGPTYHQRVPENLYSVATKKPRLDKLKFEKTGEVECAMVTIQPEGSVPIGFPELEDLNFTGSEGSIPGFIPGGRQNTADLENTYPGADNVLAKYPQMEWLLAGQSRNFSIYTKNITGLFKQGEKYQSTIFIHNRQSNKNLVIVLPEWAGAYVFDDVVAFQGFEIIQGGSRTPSGKVYVYFPDGDDIAKNQTDSALSLRPIGATKDRVFLASGPGAATISKTGVPHKIYALPFAKNELGTLSELTTVSGIPLRMFSVN